MDEDEARDESQPAEEPAEEPAAEPAPQPDMSAFDARIDAMEQRINDMAEAIATMSMQAEEPAGKAPDTDPEPDDEFGEAVDLDEVENMLGL